MPLTHDTFYCQEQQQQQPQSPQRYGQRAQHSVKAEESHKNEQPKRQSFRSPVSLTQPLLQAVGLMYQLVAKRYSESAGVDCDRHDKAWRTQQRGSKTGRHSRKQGCKRGFHSRPEQAVHAPLAAETMQKQVLRNCRHPPHRLTKKLEGSERNCVHGVASIG